MGKEYDDVEINYNKQESQKNLKFQQYQDLNKFDDAIGNKKIILVF
jgi:hypothetical protein